MYFSIIHPSCNAISGVRLYLAKVLAMLRVKIDIYTIRMMRIIAMTAYLLLGLMMYLLLGKNPVLNTLVFKLPNAFKFFLSFRIEPM